MQNEGILCVLTGMEKSGTTFLSKLLAANPAIMCGFECGLLLSRISDFHKVQPFYDWMSESTDIGHWGIRPEDMETVCRAGSFRDAYSRIHRYAGRVGSERSRACFRDAKWIIDKTPKYIFHLEQVMEKIDVPFIVIEKDIVHQYRSFQKRSIRMEDFLVAYSEYRCHLNAAQKRFPNRILLVSYRRLLVDPDATMKEIYHFLNIPWYPKTSLYEFYKKTGMQRHGGLREHVSVNEDAPALPGWKKRLLPFFGRRTVSQLRMLLVGMPYWIACKVAVKRCIDILCLRGKP